MYDTFTQCPPGISITVHPEVVDLVEDWRFDLQLINREDAERMLAVERRNRRINPRIVTQYVDDMTSGRWKFTPELIILGPGGEIIEGQHRLTAIVESGVGRPFLVVSNVDTDLLDVMGTGASRPPAQVLDMEGVGHARSVVPAARLLHNYLHVPPNLRWRGSAVDPLSPAAILQFLDDLPAPPKVSVGGRSHFVRCVESAMGMSRATAIPVSPLAVGLYLTSFDVPLPQLDWRGPLVTGVGLSASSPILALRDLMLKQTRKSGRSSFVEPKDILAAYLAAWIAWREGREVSSLRVPGVMPSVGLPTAALDPRSAERSKTARGVHREASCWSHQRLNQVASRYVLDALASGQEITIKGLGEWLSSSQVAGQKAPSLGVFKVNGWGRYELDSLVRDELRVANGGHSGRRQSQAAPPEADYNDEES